MILLSRKSRRGRNGLNFFSVIKSGDHLGIGDQFYLVNHANDSILATVEQILISSNLKELVLKFPLHFLGECDYNVAVENLKQWFSDENIEKYSVMGVLIKIEKA